MNIKNMINMTFFLLYYQLKLTKLPYKPFFAWIEPTNICNLKCKNCPQAKGLRREKGFMALDLFKNIITSIEVFQPILVTLHLAGEPLLHKQIHEMISIVKKVGLETSFASNGMVLTEDKAELLIDSGLDSIKFDFSSDKDEFEDIKIGAKWGTVLENIKGLLELKEKMRSAKPFVTIRHLTLKTEKSHGVEVDFLNLRKIFQEYSSVNIIPYNLHSWSGKFGEAVEKDPAYAFSKCQAHYYPCSHLWTAVNVLWDGTVVPCCRDLDGDYILGDVSKNPLSEIWNNDRLLQIRKKQRERQYAEVYLCRGCSKLWENKKPSNLLVNHLFRGPRKRM